MGGLMQEFDVHMLKEPLEKILEYTNYGPVFWVRFSISFVGFKREAVAIQIPYFLRVVRRRQKILLSDSFFRPSIEATKYQQAREKRIFTSSSQLPSLFPRSLGFPFRNNRAAVVALNPGPSFALSSPWYEDFVFWVLWSRNSGWWDRDLWVRAGDWGRQPLICGSRRGEVNHGFPEVVGVPAESSQLLVDAYGTSDDGVRGLLAGRVEYGFVCREWSRIADEWPSWVLEVWSAHDRNYFPFDKYFLINCRKLGMYISGFSFFLARYFFSLANFRLCFQLYR